jgi:uncharacterized protein (TIRG00374 family)
LRLAIPENRWVRVIFLTLPFAVAMALIWWRGPDWKLVRDAFTIVRWRWVFAAIGLNLLSVLTRAIAWDVAIRQAVPPPHPRFRSVFSAFGVGLFANAVLPGRVGELARVVVLSRKIPRREGTFATLVGSVFAHRVFDLFPMVLLTIWVLLTAKIPHWAITSLIVACVVGFVLFAFALLGARRHHRPVLNELGPVRQLVSRARQGLAVMREPWAAALAIFFQTLGWLCQLLAVYTAMRAFHIHLPLPAAGLVLLLMNVASIFPLWPGNIGLLQAAVALPLVQYGVPYARAFAFGIGLQAIEVSVGVGIGLIFLAREGISYAVLKDMPAANAPGSDDEEFDEAEAEQEEPARARVPG